MLLKNDNSLLPLRPGMKLFVTGPTANSMRSLNGGWSYSWQGHIADAYAKDHNTILEALQQRFGNDNIIYRPTVTFDEKGSWQSELRCTDAEFAEAAVCAVKADALILCIGENSYCETPGNLSDLHLSPLQRDMVRRFASLDRPIILVLNEGRPRIIADIEPLASAVIDIMLPGNFRRRRTGPPHGRRRQLLRQTPLHLSARDQFARHLRLQDQRGGRQHGRSV